MIVGAIYFGIVFPKAIDISHIFGFVFIVAKVILPVAGAGNY
jgi:hypothetical protein